MLQRGRLKPMQASIGNPRAVVVGATTFTGNWRWPAEFLFQYLVSRLGYDWWREQQNLPFGQRHVLVDWGHEAIHHVPGDAFTGRTRALDYIAYNLFISDNHGLETESIVKRLRAPENLLGAAYELHVRAVFLFNGFRIVLENEADTRSKHCEFDAFHDEAGIAVSVEAKTTSRPGFFGAPGDPCSPSEFAPKIKHKLHNALKKPAKHPRVIFIELQLPGPLKAERPPHGFTAFHGPVPQWKAELTAELNDLAAVGIRGQPAPPFLVAFSCMPFHLDPEGPGGSYSHFRSVGYPGWVQAKRHPSDEAYSTSTPITDLPLLHVVMHAGMPLETPSFFNNFEGIPGDDAPGYYAQYQRRWQAAAASPKPGSAPATP